MMEPMAVGQSLAIDRIVSLELAQERQLRDLTATKIQDLSKWRPDCLGNC